MLRRATTLLTRSTIPSGPIPSPPTSLRLPLPILLLEESGASHRTPQDPIDLHESLDLQPRRRSPLSSLSTFGQRVLGTFVVALFALAYGLFVYHGQGIDCSTLPSRCIKLSIACFLLAGDFAMPVGRAPNFLVFYIILDKVLAFVLRRLDSTFRHQQLHSLVS